MPLNLFASFKSSIQAGERQSATQSSPESSPQAARPFAVLDVETTGLFPKRDRVIEIAILTCSPELEIEQTYSTLINPERDLGEFKEHQISAGMLVEAPKFQEIAGDIYQHIANRIIVGHNVQFDIALLEGEFERMGIFLPAPSRLCTMHLAYKLGPSQRKLTDCCAHHGISIENAHSALDDAKATLSLLRAYKQTAEQNGLSIFTDLCAFIEGEPARKITVPATGKVFSRSHYTATPKVSYLSGLLNQLPDTGNAETASYYCALDRVLEDRKVTLEEMGHLQSLAEQASLSQAAVINAHRDYLRELVKLALTDNVITESESKDLESVTNLLGFEPAHLQELIETVRRMPVGPQEGASKPNTELVGKKVCFTGALTSCINGKPITRGQALELAIDKGLIATDSVTKATDILVLADPDSMSGKAKKARQYGTRLMTDRAFWAYVGVMVD